MAGDEKCLGMHQLQEFVRRQSNDQFVTWAQLLVTMLQDVRNSAKERSDGSMAPV